MLKCCRKLQLDYIDYSYRKEIIIQMGMASILSLVPLKVSSQGVFSPWLDL